MLYAFVVLLFEQLLVGSDAYIVICSSAQVLDWLDYVSVSGQIRERLNELVDT